MLEKINEHLTNASEFAELLLKDMGANAALPVRTLQAEWTTDPLGLPELVEQGIDLENEIAFALSKELLAETMLDVFKQAEASPSIMTIEFSADDIPGFATAVTDAIAAVVDPVLILTPASTALAMTAGILERLEGVWAGSETYRLGTIDNRQAFVNAYSGESYLLICGHGWLEANRNQGFSTIQDGKNRFKFGSDVRSTVDTSRVVRVNIDPQPVWSI